MRDIFDYIQADFPFVDTTKLYAKKNDKITKNRTNSAN